MTVLGTGVVLGDDVTETVALATGVVEADDVLFTEDDGEAVEEPVTGVVEAVNVGFVEGDGDRVAEAEGDEVSTGVPYTTTLSRIIPSSTLTGDGPPAAPAPAMRKTTAEPQSRGWLPVGVEVYRGHVTVLVCRVVEGMLYATVVDAGTSGTKEPVVPPELVPE